MSTILNTNPNPNANIWCKEGDLVFTDDNGYDTVLNDREPDWQEQYHVLKDADGKPVGLFRGPVDNNNNKHFTLYNPNDSKKPMTPLNATSLDPMDFDTQVTFRTLPVLEIWHYASGGILLKYPD